MEMRYPQLLDKYEAWLDNHSLNEIDDIDIGEEFIIDLNWDVLYDEQANEIYDGIISDLFILNRQRKMEKLIWKRLGIDNSWRIPKK
jgi:hypothetical protein